MPPTIADDFSCPATAGSYKITVWVEDDGGHKSNEIANSINVY
jgi:hypothetical protein